MWRWFLFLIALGFPGIAWAQEGCFPNPNLTPLTNSPAGFVDGCPLPAAGLNSALLIPPAALNDTLTGPITASRTTLLVSSNGTKPDAVIGTNVNYNALAGLAVANAGGTLINTNAVAGYILNNNSPGGVSKNAVALYGSSVSNVPGSWSWGINTLCTTATGLSAGAECYNELDMNFQNAADIGTGLLIQGGSTAQPVAATGLEIGPLAIGNRAIQWGTGIEVLDGVTNGNGIVLGAQSVTAIAGGVSQSLVLQSYDTGSVKRNNIIFGSPTGMAFSSTIPIPIFQFNGNINISSPNGLLINGEAVVTDVSHTAAFATDSHITSVTIGNTTATISPQGPFNLSAVSGAGAASKYVCVDSGGNVLIQSGAC